MALNEQGSRDEDRTPGHAAGAGERHDTQLEQILNSSPAVAFVWEMEEGWPVSYVSDNVRQFGYEPADFYDGSVKFADIVDAADRKRLAEEVERQNASGVGEFHQRYRIVTRDGKVRWVSDWTRTLRDETGHVRRHHGLIFDITRNVEIENRAQRYLATVGDMFVALDLDGRVTAVNDATCRLTEESENDLIGSDWIDRFVPQEARAGMVRYLERIAAGDASPEIQEGESDIVSRTGNRRTVHWRHTPDHDPDGGVRGVIAFGVDVTEQRKIEKRMRDLARFPQEDPSPILRLDRNGDVLHANAAAMDLINTLAEDVPGRRDLWSNLVKRAIGARTREFYEISTAAWTYVFDIVPVDGTDYVNLYGRDVTREKEHETRLRDIADTLPGAIFQYTYHSDGTDSVQYMNAVCEDIWELPAAEIAHDATPLWDIIVPEDLPAMKASVMESAEKLSLWDAEWRIKPKSGRERWLRGRGRPRKLENGDIQWNTIIVDVTARKNAAKRAFEALKKTIHVLSVALEARDPYTAGHQRAAADIAVKIGRKLGFDQHRLDGLQLAASVFDVGKIQIPAEILNRPATLSEAEYDLVRTHAEVGARFLDEVEFEWPVADFIYQHHERFDGSGYPNGLARDDILPEARIIGVADTLHAMISHRPYRPAMPLHAAAEGLRANAGVIFDPDVAKACLALIEAGEIVFPQ